MILALDTMNDVPHRTSLMIVAYKPETAEAARQAAARTTGKDAKPIIISGHEFWQSYSERELKDEKLRHIVYAILLKDLVLEIHVLSFDTKITEELRRDIESMSFFDPAHVREVAGPESQLYEPTYLDYLSAAPSISRISKLDPGTVKGNTYANEELGFSYEVPAGWEVIDAAHTGSLLEGGHRSAWGDNPSAAREHEAIQQCARVLLLARNNQEVTKPQAAGSFGAVIAIDLQCFRNPKTPAPVDESDEIKNLALQMQRSLTGRDWVAGQQTAIKTSTLQDHVMLEISDVSAVKVPGLEASLRVFSTSVFTSLKDYWVAWMFQSGSHAELEELRKNKIAFNKPLPTRPATTSPPAPSLPPR